MSAAVNTLIATVDKHGEIHVPAADAARLGVAPGQDVVLAAAPRGEIRALPQSLSIDQLAARQGKIRGRVRRIADFPQLFDSQEELDDFLALIGVGA